MSPDHVDFADWDAAYLVGALSPADRRLFEEHVDGCRACRDALAELAPTLGLLSRVAPDRAESLLQPTPDPGDAAVAGPAPGARAAFVARAAREARHARRRRALGWGGVLAAAAIAVVAFVLATTIRPATQSVEVVALEPVADVSLTATVALSEVPWGTRLEMVCRYPDDADAPPEGWAYVLVVTAEDGSTSELSTWRARPGSTTRLDAGTALDADDIAAIEVRSIDGSRVLLRGEPPAG